MAEKKIMNRNKVFLSTIEFIKFTDSKHTGSMRMLILIYTFSVISSSLVLLQINSIRSLINGVSLKDIDMVTYAVFMIIAINIFLIPFFCLINEYMSYKLLVRMNEEIQTLAADNLLKCGFEDIKKHHSTDLLSTLYVSISKSLSAIVLVIKNMLSAICSSIVVIVYLFYKGPSLFFGVMAITALLSIALIPLMSKYKKYYSEEEKARLNVESFIQDSISGAEIIRTYSIKKMFSGIFLQRYKTFLKKAKMVSIINSAIMNVKFVIGLAGVLFIFSYGWILVVNGKMDIGALLAFVIGFWICVEPVARISILWSEYLQAVFHMEKVSEILNFSPEYEKNTEVCKDRDMIDLKAGKIHISFDKVCFKYGKDEVLNNISFDVKDNTVVAIVGPSGSGKTTLLNLLLGFEKPCSGLITINDRPMLQYGIESLRKVISFVPQEPVIFNTTFYNNIFSGKLGASKEEIIQAANLSGIHDFICSSKYGYFTPVSEGALNISGGEKQRIAIARALVRDPRILILDEPTSSLDSYNESLVNNIIARTKKTGIVFVVSHRMSTITNADLILFISKGKMAESGSHKYLMAKRGMYYKWITDDKEKCEGEMYG
jgi:ATP-binding cassette subfamily B protein AbcA/BmrA